MNKLIIFFLVLTLMSGTVLTAQVSINNDNSVPDGSAMLDVKSSDKGVLFPRLTFDQISSINNPANGLTVYNTDENKFYFFDGSVNQWKEIAIGSGTILSGCGSVVDEDGNFYQTVTIGSQCWMAKNLATTKYNDGTPIPLVSDGASWIALSTPAYCWYDNDEATYGETYGALYNWYTVETGNLCPDGWHVPTFDDFIQLKEYIWANGHAMYTEGTALKSTSGWDSGGNGTDDFNFSALPAGLRSQSNGLYYVIGEYSNFFTSTLNEYSITDPWAFDLYYSQSSLDDFTTYKTLGCSVRCVKED